MLLKIKLLTDNAKTPTYAKQGDSGMDVYAAKSVEIPPRGFALIPTDVAVELPKGWGIQVRPRSGLFAKHGIVGQLGTIDNGYRGGIGVALYNHTDKPFCVVQGDRIAQLVVERVERAKVKIVSELSASERGTCGFGSTGF